MENSVQPVQVVEPNNFLMYTPCMSVGACPHLTLRVRALASVFLYLPECTRLRGLFQRLRPFYTSRMKKYTSVFGHQLCVLLFFLFFFFKWFATDVCHSHFNQINITDFSTLKSVYIRRVYNIWLPVSSRVGHHAQPARPQLLVGVTCERSHGLYIFAAAMPPLIKAA